jgi:hypothetical protein
MREKFPLLSLLPSCLRPGRDGSVTEHCDPETLTAFAERTLHLHERDQVAHHLSLCPDCREVLALASGTNIPAVNSKTRPANLLWPWLYSGAAVAAVCLAVLFLPSTEPPVTRPMEKSTTPKPTFSPQLTAATIAAPVLPGLTPVWRVNSSRYPASLEVSYDNRRSWTTIHTPALHPKSVASEGPRVWVANDDGTILQSNDGGLHWTPLRPTVHVAAVEASATH